MADTTKEKILKINTQGAEKNVKSLKTQIRELKEQLAQLDKGTAEYDKVAKQLADTNQKQIEINEAMKYSNKDLGATLSNLTKVSAGVVGAISSINSVMVLMGADSEEAQEAMKKIQSLMAIIQGLSAIDTAVKALKGLTVAFQGFNDVRVKSITTSLGASGAELAEAGALAENTVKMHKNNEEAVEFNRLNKEGEEATKKSKDAIDEETKSLIANKEAKEGNTDAAQEYINKLDEIYAKRNAQKDIGQEIGADVVNRELEEAKKNLAFWEKELNTGKKLPHEIEYVSQKILQAKNKIAELENATKDASQNIITSLSQSLKDGLDSWDDEIESVIDDLIDAASIDELGDVYSKTFQQEYAEIEKAQQAFRMGFIETEEELEDSTIRIEEYYEQQRLKITQAIDAKKIEVAQEEHLKRQIAQTIEAENAETASLNGNTAAKDKNALATQNVTNSEQTLGTATKKNDPILRKAWSGLTTGIKNAAKALKSFIVSNPILAVIAASLALVAGAVALVAHNTKKALADLRAETELNNELNHTYEEQQIRLNVLLRTAKDETQTVNERKKAIEELNKLVPNYNAELDKTTGKYKENTNALNLYLSKLREKIELEAYEGRIKDLLQQRLELEQKLIKVQTSGWNLFGWRVNSIKKDIKEIDKEMDKMYKKIDQLYLPWALDENNNKNGGVGGIKKTFTELFDDLKSLWKEFYKQITQSKEIDRISDGVYTKAQLALDKLMEYINGNLISDKLSDQFKKALKNGFAGLDSIDITPKFVFSEDYIKELQDRIQKQKDELKEMLKQENVSEKLLEKQRNRVKSTQAELDNIFNITKQTKEVLNLNKELNKAFSDRNKSNKQYMQQQSIEQEYYQKMKRNYGKKYQYDELFKEIELQKLSNKYAEERKAEYEKELDLMTQRQIKNRKEYEELLAKGKLSDEDIKKFKEKQKLEEKDFEYLKKNGKFTDEEIKKFKENQTEKAHLLDEELEKRKKIDEENKKINEGNVAINTANWKIRLQKLDEEYDKIKGISELEQYRLELQRTLKGGGVVDYNLDLDIINSQIKAIKKQRDYINQFYADRQDRYVKYSAEWQSLENERRAAIDEINRKWDEKDLERERVQMERKLNIQKTYINLYSAISGQISNILSAEMDMYDSNTEEYKKLKYRQGVISTAEGVLGAFMSGVESGVPAPWNLAVAFAMAATTLTAGIMQLNNIKNEKVGGTMPTTTDLSSREYDTLSYQTNVDTLSAIQDQRVIVVESDITDTQRRVEVAETQAVF